MYFKIPFYRISSDRLFFFFPFCHLLKPKQLKNNLKCIVSCTLTIKVTEWDMASAFHYIALWLFLCYIFFGFINSSFSHFPSPWVISQTFQSFQIKIQDFKIFFFCLFILFLFNYQHLETLEWEFKLTILLTMDEIEENTVCPSGTMLAHATYKKINVFLSLS